VYWVEWDGIWCELMVCEWKFRTTYDSFMLALHVHSMSDVPGLKLASLVDATPESSFGRFWRDGSGTLVSMSAGLPRC
jgi:hypothetical protein